jgi:predicted dinucleotide-binding enzyme
MNIAIIGAGRIGGAYGKTWAAAGHRITFGVRDPAALDALALVENSETSRVSTISEAVRDAEVVLLAVPGAAAEAVLAGLELTDKVLIDATNSFSAAPGESSKRLALQARGAKLVKAFNTAGFDLVGAANFANGRADAFVCGEDADARLIVARLARDAGFEPCDLGGLDSAGTLDLIARAWGGLSRALGSRRVALKVLH